MITSKIGRGKNMSIAKAALKYFYEQVEKKERKDFFIYTGDLNVMHSIIDIAGAKHCSAATTHQVVACLNSSPYWKVTGHMTGWLERRANAYTPSKKGREYYEKHLGEDHEFKRKKMEYINKIITGDSLKTLKTFPDQSVNMCVTSPPYWGLRDYGVTPTKWADGWVGCLGLEPTPERYVENIVDVFREVKRVLKDDGTLWLNLGDSYAANRSYQVVDNKHIDVGNKKPSSVPVGLKPKDLVGIPWRVAFALQADGWYLRQDIIWHKPNPMPESVTDRCTKAHEYIFLLSKSQKYYYDHEAIKEKSTGSTKGAASSFKRTGSKRGESICPNSPMPTHRENRSDIRYDGPLRNKRSVWTVSTKPFKDAHYATFPPDLIISCIKAGCPEGGIVLDLFMGSGTTAETALKLNRKFTGIELNPDNVEMSKNRIEHIIEQGQLFI